MLDGLPVLAVLCGLQCSGKSTAAKKFTTKFDSVSDKWIILSSDAIRAEQPTWDNAAVFNYIHNEINKNLAAGINVLIDATNTTYKARSSIFNCLKVKCTKICHIMNTPFDECMERLKVRNLLKDTHYVPEDVLLRYYQNFEIPFKEEGWDYITFENEIEPLNGINTDLRGKLFGQMLYFDQKCKWHLETLDEHAIMVRQILKLSDLATDELIESATWHDYGKLKTQKPKEKEPNEMCYYRHESVGAYDLMCIPNLFNNAIDVLFYINYHMKGFDAKKSEKTYNKLLKRFGTQKFTQLMLFNNADCNGVVTNEKKYMK